MTLIENTDGTHCNKNKKYQKKLDGVKNEMIKKSLIELTKVFKEK